MKPGVGFPSYAAGATWSGNGWAAAYPITNVADLINLTEVARTSSSGVAQINFALTSAQPIQLVSVANHNMGAADSYRLQLYQDEALTQQVADTGALNFPAPVLAPDGSPRFVQTLPIYLNAPAMAQYGTLILRSDTHAIEVGGIDVSGWFGWPGISLGRATGLDSTQTTLQLGGGYQSVADEFTMRQISGQIDYVLLKATGPYMDFQAILDLAEPFCFVNDITDPTSWPRLCMMATNVKTDPFKGVVYRADAYPFTFNEHIR